MTDKPNPHEARQNRAKKNLQTCLTLMTDPNATSAEVLTATNYLINVMAVGQDEIMRIEPFTTLGLLPATLDEVIIPDNFKVN